MILYRLKLENFRNYARSEVLFHHGMNVLFGQNGQGKTNILESIYYLALTKSFRSSNDRNLIRYRQTYFRVEGEFKTVQGRVWKSAIAYSPDKGKRLMVNGEKITKFSEYIGRIPVVLLAPGDLEISQAGPAHRRRFLDILLSQAGKLYLHHLVEYRRSLRQRNTILQEETSNPALLESWDEALIEHGVGLMEKRQEAVQFLDEWVKKYYRELSGREDRVKIVYQSSVKWNGTDSPAEAFRQALRQQRQRELALQMTTVGPHRDDLLFLLNGKPLRAVGSQGEHKTFVIALKLAEIQYLRQMQSEPPILLFDDIFGELDEQRIGNMVRSLTQIGQVFITTTSPDFFGKLPHWQEPASFYRIEAGQIQEALST